MSDQPLMAASADAINRAHEGLVAAGYKMLDRALDVGKLLVEEKDRHARGEWIPWMDENLEFDPSQARRYMKLWRGRDLLPNKETSPHFGLNGALKQIAAKEKEDKPTAKPKPPATPDPEPEEQMGGFDWDSVTKEEIALSEDRKALHAAAVLLPILKAARGPCPSSRGWASVAAVKTGVSEARMSQAARVVKIGNGAIDRVWRGDTTLGREVTAHKAGKNPLLPEVYQRTTDREQAFGYVQAIEHLAQAAPEVRIPIDDEMAETLARKFKNALGMLRKRVNKVLCKEKAREDDDQILTD